MTTQELVDELTPYCMYVLIQNKEDFIASLNKYLETTGFWGCIIGTITKLFMSQYFWTFILGTLLPFAIKIVLFVVIALFAPYLVPLEPLFDMIIDFIDNSLLSLEQKAAAKALIAAFINAQPVVDVTLAPGEASSLLSSCKYLEKYSTSSNPLFVRQGQ